MSKVDYIGLVEALNAELVCLQNMKAKTPGGKSPGKYLVIELDGEEIRLDPPIIEAIDRALKDRPAAD